MPVEILMPALSPTMEEGTLSKWLVKQGDDVAPGDVIAEIETDKATMEVEAVDEGIVSRILVPEGAQNVKVNTPIAVLAAENDTGADAAEADTAENVAAVQQVSDNGAATASSQVENEPSGDAALTAPHIATGVAADTDDDVPEGTGMVATTVREALRDAMAEEMRADSDIFVMGEEVAEYQGAYKVTQGLLQEFGKERVIDTPITEHGFAGLGVGAAFAGLKPVIEFMTFNFAMQAIDQIINSAAKTHYMSGGQISSPIVFRGPNGPASRVGAQHSQDFSAWYAHIPGLIVVSPYSAADAKGLLKSAIRNPNPVVFLENELLYGQSFDVPAIKDWTVPLGKAKIVRKGSDVTLVSHSMGMRYATEATQKLVAAGVDVELVDLRTLRPLDMPTILRSVSKTGRCVTVEEGWPQGSIGSEISARLMEEAFDDLDAPVLRITGKDVPMPYAANLEKLALPSVEEVIEAVNAVSYR